MRSATDMRKFLGKFLAGVIGTIALMSRRRFAAVEPFGECHALLVVVAELLVEGMDLRVVVPHHELKLHNAARPEPVFRGRHDRTAIALVAMVGIDGNVIDPAAMTIMADQHRRDGNAPIAAQQDRCVGALARQHDVACGIIPRARQPATLPQRCHVGDVIVVNGRDGQLVTACLDIHNTFPGFMMPCGSSIALTCRISSIATLSLTSGSSSRLSTPMPCSAEIDPPILSTMSNTTALTSCQRPRKSAVLPPIGWLTL